MTQEPIRTIIIRPGTINHIEIAKGENYRLSAPYEIDKEKIIFTLDYRLHDSSYYKVQNTNTSPVTIEIYPT